MVRLELIVPKSRGILYGIAAALVLLTIFGRVPGHSRFSEELQNGAHAPVFCVLAIIIFNLVRRTSFRRSLTAILCVGIGIGIEIVQFFLGGDASAVDVLHDIVGAGVGLLVVSDARSVFGRRMMLAGAVVGGLFAFAPLLWCVAAYANRQAKFPVLGQFRHTIDEYFIEGPTTEISIQALPQMLGGSVRATALQVRLPSVEWPGLDLGPSVPDWSGYRQLCAELGNPESQPLMLHLRVNDAVHDGRMNDRFNFDFEIGPARQQTTCVSLSKIQSAPRTRLMDLQHMDRLILFGDAAVAGRTFFVQKVWLQ